MTDKTNSFSRIGVVGGGAWGTALAILCAGNGRQVTQWVRQPEQAARINQTRRNEERLPGVAVPESIIATADLAAVSEADAILYVAPAQRAREIFGDLNALGFDRPVAICAKGIELQTGHLLPEVLQETCPGADVAMLSGPSFAIDVAKGRPTAVTLGCIDQQSAEGWISALTAPHFRLYRSTDVQGVALGGAVKNVLAIAAGAVDGAGLGESARAALIARGFAEFQRLGTAIGARSDTMAGLSGLGDLILTATSRTSRNMSLGVELGLGEAPAEILAKRSTVSEGAATAKSVLTLAARHDVEMPICQAVADLISGARGVGEIADALLARPLREEGT